MAADKNKPASEPFLCIALNNQCTVIAAILGSSVMCPKAITTTNMWDHIKPCNSSSMVSSDSSYTDTDTLQ